MKAYEDLKFQRYKNYIKSNFIVFLILIINLFFFLFFIIQLKSLKKEVYFLSFNKVNKSNKKIENNNNENILSSFIRDQNTFCKNEYINYIQEYEESIELSDVKINNIEYKMYLYKYKSGIRRQVKRFGAYERNHSINILNALNYYKNKYNIINNKDIHMIDIGGHIGWYPSFLGRYNYTILSFEPSEKNNYIAKKNYCLLNKNSNVVLIAKGLGKEEKYCGYFKDISRTGNGMIICDKNEIEKYKKIFIKTSLVEIIKLSKFIPFLSDKKVALIKIDVEGAEAQALEGGSELITKYHVPFVFVEFSPNFLKEHNTDPRKFAQFFIDNGYKISIESFLSKNYITKDELLDLAGFQINCYFIHKDIIDTI